MSSGRPDRRPGRAPRRTTAPPRRAPAASRRAPAASRRAPAASRRGPATPRRGPRTSDHLPIIGRLLPMPAEAKVPEIVLMFWVVKILTTAGGEATSDFLKRYGNFGGGGVEVGLFLIGLVLQFTTHRYRAIAYWFLAYAIAIAGTGIADFLHLDVHIPYADTSILWAVVLAVVFLVWHRSEGTLSIHSIHTQRREAFYWATVFATFALGTALGDYTALSLGMGYLPSGIFFLAVFLVPGLAFWKFGLNSIAAFWMSYVVTRPLGASFADWVSKPRATTGLGFGDGQTALLISAVVLILVVYLAVARLDIQANNEALAEGNTA